MLWHLLSVHPLYKSANITDPLLGDCVLSFDLRAFSGETVGPDVFSLGIYSRAGILIRGLL